MKTIQEIALERYPIKLTTLSASEQIDMYASYRKAFIEGYNTPNKYIDEDILMNFGSFVKGEVLKWGDFEKAADIEELLKKFKNFYKL